MTLQSSSHSLLPWADGFATKGADALILIGREMFAWVFVGVAYGAITNFAGSVAYFTSQKTLPARALDRVALLLELLISASLILGIGTRCGDSGIRVCGGSYCDSAPPLPALSRSVNIIIL
jgi:hypothetical protein